MLLRVELRCVLNGQSLGAVLASTQLHALNLIGPVSLIGSGLNIPSLVGYSHGLWQKRHWRRAPSSKTAMLDECIPQAFFRVKLGHIKSSRWGDEIDRIAKQAGISQRK